MRQAAAMWTPTHLSNHSDAICEVNAVRQRCADEVGGTATTRRRAYIAVPSGRVRNDYQLASLMLLAR